MVDKGICNDILNSVIYTKTLDLFNLPLRAYEHLTTQNFSAQSFSSHKLRNKVQETILNHSTVPNTIGEKFIIEIYSLVL